MAAKKAKKGASRTPARRKTPRKAQPGSAGLEPRACVIDGSEVKGLADRIEAGGGAVIGSYKDPLRGHPLVLAVLPIGAIVPTPVAPDLSEAHHKRLAEVIAKTGRFLDPVIAVTAPGQGFWTPN